MSIPMSNLFDSRTEGYFHMGPHGLALYESWRNHLALGNLYFLVGFLTELRLQLTPLPVFRFLQLSRSDAAIA